MIALKSKLPLWHNVQFFLHLRHNSLIMIWMVSIPFIMSLFSYPLSRFCFRGFLGHEQISAFTAFSQSKIPKYCNFFHNGIIWTLVWLDAGLLCQWGAEAGLWEGQCLPRDAVCGPWDSGAQHSCQASSCRLVGGEPGGLSAWPSHGPKRAWQSLGRLGTMVLIL